MARKIESILCVYYDYQRAKFPNLHTYVEMGNIITQQKNELVCVDLLGPLPKGSRGMNNLVVCMDAFN